MPAKPTPRIKPGKEIIKRIHEVKDTLTNDIKIAYLTNYDTALGASPFNISPY